MLVYQLTETNDYYYDTTMVAASLGISRSKLKRIIRDYPFSEHEAILYKNRLLVREQSLTGLQQAMESKKLCRQNKTDQYLIQ